MKINVIATGSSGNMYEIVDCAGNSLLIEAGKSRHDYMKNKISDTAPEMCIISHMHMDHAQYMGEFKAMIPTFSSQVENQSENWKAYGYHLKHGEGRSTVYIVKSLVENKFLFFGTDFEFSNCEDGNFEYQELFNALIELKVDLFLIECNYNDFLMHKATPEQKQGCSRHLSDNDVINFMKIVKPRNPKIILIHGSNRLSADIYTKKYISSKIIDASVFIAVGASQGVKNIFEI